MERKSHSTIMGDILHHVYTVLHDPLFREAYALNLKRDEKGTVTSSGTTTSPAIENQHQMVKY